MATTSNMTKSFGAANAVAGIGDGQQCKVMVCEYTITAANVINDLLQSPTLPKGAVIFDVMLCTSDLDTSTGVTLDVGYGADPDYFIAATTIGQTGGVVRASAATAKPLTLTTNDTIDILFKTAASGTAATSGSISLAVFYVMNTA